MASLTGSSIASSYTSLLKLNGNSDNIVAGNDSNAIQIVDGDGTASPLYLNTDRLGIGGQPTASLSILRADDSKPHISLHQSEGSGTTYNILSDDAGSFSIREASDTRLKIDTNGNSTFYNSVSIEGSTGRLTIKSTDTSAGDAVLALVADNATANGDFWQIEADGSTTKQLKFQSFANGSAYVPYLILDANSRISLSNNDSSGEASSTFLGYQAGNAIASGAHKNLAIGHQALYQADACNDSIAIGYQALGGTDAGTNVKNIAIGTYALDAALANSQHNIAIGYNALTAATGGQSNVAIGGSGAGGAITTADKIVAIGDGALGGAVQSDGNTGVGYACLYGTTGAKNTGFGYQSANTVTDGTENTVVGWDADVSASGAVNQTVIGSETTGVADNSVTLGNSSVNNVYMASDSGAKVWCTNIDSSSDARIKKNVEKITLGLDFVNELNPVTFNMRKAEEWDDDLKKEQVWYENIDSSRDIDDEESKIGFIAQEVKACLDKYNVDCDIHSVQEHSKIEAIDYSRLVVPLVKAVQELTAKVAELEKK